MKKSWAFATFLYLWLSCCAFAGVDEARTRGLSWLVANQQLDGSPASFSGLEVQSAGAVAEAMVAGGMSRSPQLARLSSWLANAEAASLDARAWQTMALVMAGRDTSVVGGIVRDARNTAIVKNGSYLSSGIALWGALPGYGSSVPDTALGYGALRTAAISYTSDTTHLTYTILCHIIPAQLTAAPWNGGWSMNFPQSVQASHLSNGSLFATALMLYEIKKQRLANRVLTKTECDRTAPAAVDSAIDLAKTWILAQANGDGGFAERNPQTGLLEASNLLATSFAIRALDLFASEGDAGATAAVSSARNWLVGRQEPDGGWAANPLVTARVLASFPTVSGGQATDSDSDGLPDVLEAALGANPLIVDSHTIAGGATGGTATYAISAVRFFANKFVAPAAGTTDVDPYLGSSGPYVISGSLPDGMNFNAVDGAFEGKAKVTGLFDFEVSSTADPDQRLLVSLCVLSQDGSGDVDTDGVIDNFELEHGDDPCGSGDAPLFTYNSPFPSLEGMPGAKFFGPTATVWNDFDDDGDLDAVVYRQTVAEYVQAGCPAACPGWYDKSYYGWLSYYENTTGGYVRYDIAGGQNPNGYRMSGVVSGGLFVFDYDRDGRKDVLIAVDNAKRFAGLYRNTSQGAVRSFVDVTATSGLATLVSWSNSKPMMVLDANGDGYPDIVTANRLLVFNAVLGKYEDKRGGSGLASFLQRGPAQAIDLNGDARLDVVAFSADPGVTGLQYFRNEGTGTFTRLPLSGAGSPSEFYFHDLDGDGLTDLLGFYNDDGLTYGSASVTALRNTAAGLGADPSFESITSFAGLPVEASTPSSSPSRGGTVGDIDGDGFLDFVASSDVSSAAYSGRGDFVFEAMPSLGRIEQTGGDMAAIVDFDLDGSVDVDTGWIFHRNVGYRKGNSVAFRLKTPRTASGVDVLGAHIRVDTPDGRVRRAQSRVSEAGNPGFIQFGIGGSVSGSVTVSWPGGATSAHSFDLSAGQNVFELVEPSP